MNATERAERLMRGAVKGARLPGEAHLDNKSDGRDAFEVAKALLAVLPHHDRMLAALNKLADWEMGPVVIRGFDDPHSAAIARAFKKAFADAAHVVLIDETGFVRMLVGLDREAAKRALGTFLTAANHTANQIEFVNLVVDHLTEHGTLNAGVLYELPFTDISPRGPDELFSPEELQLLVGILSEIQTSAIAV